MTTATKEYQLVENFAPDFAEVREQVIRGGFGSHRGPDGAEYTGISMSPVPQWIDRISEILERKIEAQLSCFRLNLEGELPHSWVHSDNICAKYATVLYMNEPAQCYGGTAFWQHRILGIDRLPFKMPQEFYRSMESDWKNIDLWKQVDFVPMKSNRFITYPTTLFHSRFPFEGFGRGPSDGRLIWICFYD